MLSILAYDGECRETVAAMVRRSEHGRQTGLQCSQSGNYLLILIVYIIYLSPSSLFQRA